MANPSTNDEPWHSLPVDDIFKEFKTSPEGLTSKEARRRLKKTGPNTLRKHRPENIFHIILRQLQNPLIYVLVAATVLALVMGKMTDAIVVFSVVVINTIIGFIQEYQASRTIQGLLEMIPEHATVVRDGDQKSVPVTELVPGDYVLLQAGDRVSADMRLAAVKNLQCDESALTGESVPVAKQTEEVDEDAGIGDRSCMAFSGTLVTAGTGDGIVTATGSRTEMGKISELLETTTSLKTPLTRSLEKVAQWITWAILLVGVVLFFIGLFRGYTLADAAFSAITLAVATIPEGLPAVITIASAIGVQRMARRNAIIRHLPAVETLGSTTVICSDKTGTLTRNEMTVQALWNGGKVFRITGIGLAPKGKIYEESSEQEAPADEIEELLRAGTLCNDASLEEENHDEWKAVGDPTEVALIVASRKFKLHEEELKEQWPRLDELPFDADRKIMATLHQSPSGKKVIYLKGAPVAVMPLLMDENQEKTKLLSEKVRAAAKKLADAGMRVLTFAAKELPEDHPPNMEEGDLCNGFKLLGLQAMIDPPRTEVKASIRACQQAGISVKMITGDHPGTAGAIGRDLGILSSGQKVIAGHEIADMKEEELQQAVDTTHVFARVAPEHKLKLVKALQANGQVVAMTGDGVNDAPALKRADIGVAMGITGTAVAKESADMILADDNFQSIEAAVEEGRRVYDNLIKSIAFILPTSIGLGLVIFIAVLFFPAEEGIQLHPMQPVQVLWINLITAVALALPLALEAMEPDVMRRPPRKPNAPIMNPLLTFRMIMVASIMATGTIGLFLWEYRTELAGGASQTLALAEAQTMAVTTMVFFQAFYLINCRSLKYTIHQIGFFSNLFIFLGIAAVLLAQVAFVYVPFMNYWFHSAPLKLNAWLASAGVGAMILPVVMIEKWIRKRMAKHKSETNASG